MVYMANNKPPTHDIGHTDMVYMANNKPPTHVIGHTDVVYMANNKPPTHDIGHTDVVYMANNKPPTHDIGHTDVVYMANNKPTTRDIGHTDVVHMANNKPPTRDIYMQQDTASVVEFTAQYDVEISSKTSGCVIRQPALGSDLTNNLLHSPFLLLSAAIFCVSLVVDQLFSAT